MARLNAATGDGIARIEEASGAWIVELFLSGSGTQCLALDPADPGHGRIANRLAARGACVTGFDADPVFLERARADAAARGVEVDYVQGDMSTLPWEERFDLALNWFTSFGYCDMRAIVPGSARHARRLDREVASLSSSGIATRSHATGCP